MQTIHFQSPSGRPARLGRDRQGQLEVIVEECPEEQEQLDELVRQYGCDNLKESYRVLRTFGGVQ